MYVCYCILYTRLFICMHAYMQSCMSKVRIFMHFICIDAHVQYMSMFVYMGANMQVSLHICMHECVIVGKNVFIYVYLFIGSSEKTLFVCIYVFEYVHVYMHICQGCETHFKKT